MDTDDLALVQASRRGDAEAFAEIVRRHHGRVRSYVSGYVRDRVMVDDLCQEVFLHAFRDLGEYRHEAPLTVWLLGIARHRVLDYVRAELRRQALLTDRADEVELVLASWRRDGVEADAGRLGELDRELAALRACLQKLPPPSAHMVTAHYLKGQTAARIAEDSGRKPAAVRMALMRVRQALRECVRQRVGTEAS